MNVESGGAGVLTQNINRIDHVAIVVLPENFDRAVESYSKMLGIEFCPPHQREDIGIRVTVSWEAGIEILTPLDERSSHWNRLKERGEGYCVLVFGVRNLSEATERAVHNGARVLYEVDGLSGPEPWLDRFDVLREAKLDDIFGTSLCLGQIEPRKPQL